ncbi:MAG TPA: hypothetical protein VJL28_08570 [Gemmatimonadaceae bacterium]|nr:hypothetical protein [Gemmatimonadaceae bacterium]
MALREVKGEPGAFFDTATGKSYTISDLHEDDKYETVTYGGFWWRVRRILWMIFHPLQTIRLRIEGAYLDRLHREMYEDGECPICSRRLPSAGPNDDDHYEEDDDG